MFARLVAQQAVKRTATVFRPAAQVARPAAFFSTAEIIPGVGKGKMGLKKEENITQQGRETLEKD